VKTEKSRPISPYLDPTYEAVGAGTCICGCGGPLVWKKKVGSSLDIPILEDPDWRAWLEKKPQGEQYEDEILEFDGDFGDSVLAILVDEKKYKRGDKVKVTLELVE